MRSGSSGDRSCQRSARIAASASHAAGSRRNAVTETSNAWRSILLSEGFA